MFAMSKVSKKPPNHNITVLEDPMYADVFVPIFLFGGTAFVLFKYVEARHRERMAMIDKGLSPAEMGAASPRRPFSHPLTTLKWGLLALFVGIGIFVGNYLTNVLMIEEEPAFFGSVLLAGGLALIIHYFIASKKEKRDA
jgi:hypothetical protein